MTNLPTDTKVIIRPVHATDHEAWAELFRAYREFYRLAPDEAVIDRVWGWITDDNHEEQAFVADVGGRLADLAHYRPFSRPATGSVGMFLDDLFTAADYRGLGVGRALLGQLSALAASQGCSVVRWITADDNAPARRSTTRRPRPHSGSPTT
jgi:GNAT superfamily N-acetyltransferase